MATGKSPDLSKLGDFVYNPMVSNMIIISLLVSTILQQVKLNFHIKRSDRAYLYSNLSHVQIG